MSRLLLLAALATLAASGALAQTCTTEWAAPVDGSWTDATKWTNGAPGTGSGGLSPCITVAGTYTVSLAQGLQQSTAVTSLVLGGASGVQTLSTATVISAADVAVRPNGRWAFQNRSPGGEDGLYSTGTVTVEGEISVPGGVSFLRSGGTLDIAPSGTLRLSGQAGDVSGLFRVRGTIEGVGCPVPNAGDCGIDAPLEVLGGTLRAVDGVLRTSGGGTMNGATLDAGPAGYLTLNANAAGPPYAMTVEGTIQGSPQGTVGMSGLNLYAGPAGATLAVNGTGFQMLGTSILRSGGGSFTNTGLLLKAATGSNFSGFAEVIVRNEGLIEIPSSLALYAGSVLRNEPGGVVRATAGGRLAGDGNGTGRFENAGLFVLDAPGQSFSFSDGGNGRYSGPYSRPGSEMRVVAGTLDLVGPGSRNLPDGASLTGTGAVSVPGSFQPEGTVSPGTSEQPLGRLRHGAYFYPSQVAGSPRLVIDVDAGGRSDTLDVAFAPGGSGARLAGTLVVRVRPGYAPAIGDAFTILRTAGTLAGQFGQVVADGAPDGIAFVTEISADQRSLTLRAVAVAPDGPITVSTTQPVAGGVRPIFLTGPGAPGITAARLDCTECLDPASQARIEAEIVGEGTVREARFDLTSTRAFGAYDLVLQRAGLADSTVAVTVRPFLSFVQAVPVLERGIGVRPSGLNYNWSQFDVRTATNADEPTYALGSVGVEDAAVEYALASGNTFGIGARVLYESTSGAPAPIVFGRIPPDGSVPFTFGQRIDPSDVRFPEQASTGPDDARIPFGDDRLFLTLLAQHASYERMRRLVVESLRQSGSAPLADYLGQVDAADAAAVDDAVARTLQAQTSYVDVARTLFDRLVATLAETVAPPSGLGAEAGPFDVALDRAAEDFLADVTLAHLRALDLAPASVQALFDAEVDALAASQARRMDDDDPPLTLPPGFCNSVADLVTAGPTDSSLGNLSAIAFAAGAAPYTPAAPGLSPTATESTHTVQSFRNISQQLTGIASTLGQATSTIGSAGSAPRSRAGSGSRGGFGGGTSCGPPAAPADPNDKAADTALLCEFGTVMVDGEEVPRCVRHFVPLADAAAPIVYTIQFENLPQATANAEFVTITDELDPSLNPASLRVLATSSDSTFSASVTGRTVTFRFSGIDLPPNVEAPEGQGFVTFSVAPVGGLPEGTVIENDADIVFDFNPAIATPVVTHEVRRASDLAALVTETPGFTNPGGQVAVSAGVVNLRGDPVEDATLTLSLPPGVSASAAVPTAGECTGTAPVVCVFGGLDVGEAARVDLVLDASAASDGEIRAVASTSAFDALAANDADVVSFEVRPVGTEAADGELREPTLAAPFPNPARGAVSLRWGLPSVGRVDLRVFDLLGRQVAVVLNDETADAGWHETRWDAQVASGVYVVRLVTGTEVRTRRIVVVR